jgi:hypothetical protein
VTAVVLGALALAALLVQAVRLGVRMARALGGVALAPACTAVVLGIAAATVAEGLSLAHALGRSSVTIAAWVLLAASLLLGRARSDPRELGMAIRHAVASAGLEGRLACASLALLFAVTLFLALASPPNNADALAYHLPPLRHWLENGTVGHYPTAIDRQLMNHPLDAYLRLPLEALTRSDALFGVVQWLSYVLAAAQAAGIAWLLARDARMAWRAALLCASLPMAVLQASSTQNDLIVTAYALGGVAAMVALLREPGRLPLRRFLLAGASLGLAALTKGTGLVLACLFAPVLVWAAVRPGPLRLERSRGAAAALALLALLGAPPLVRNARTFGTPLPHPMAVPWSALADARGPARAIVQITRGLAVQLQPILARAPIGSSLLATHRSMSRALGVADDDPRLTWSADVDFLRRTSPRHEDSAGDPLHLFVDLWTVGAVLFTTRRRDPALVGMVALGVAAFVVLTVPVRFSPWNSRTQLPAMALLTVPAALALGAHGAAVSRRAVALLALLVLGSLPPLLGNAMKPLVPRGPEPLLFARTRWENRFRSDPDLRPAIENVIAHLPERCAHGATVGLRIEGHQPEYLLWAAARHLRRDVHFVHLMDARSAATCAVVTDRCPTGVRLCSPRVDPRLTVRPAAP